MKLLAYARDRSLQAEVARAIPDGIHCEWLPRPEALSERAVAADARVLLLFAEHWPDPEIEQLIAVFVPRPVVLVDLSDEGSWHGARLPAAVRLAEQADLPHQLEHLCSARALSSPGTLSLMSCRNDCDGALVAIYAAWALHQANRGRVLIIDLGMPEPDVSTYLDMRPQVHFSDLVENSAYLDQGWLQDKDIAAVPGIDVVGMPASGATGSMGAEALQRALAALQGAYDHLVLNLVGMQPSALLYALAEYCDQHWLLADQKNASLTSALRLAERLLEHGAPPGGVNLVLAPFSEQVLPDRDTIESQLPLPLRGTLPRIEEALTHINAGTLLPPPGELVPLLRAVERLLWLREPASWWRRLARRAAS